MINQEKNLTLILDQIVVWLRENENRINISKRVKERAKLLLEKVMSTREVIIEDTHAQQLMSSVSTKAESDYNPHNDHEWMNEWMICLKCARNFKRKNQASHMTQCKSNSFISPTTENLRPIYLMDALPLSQYNKLTEEQLVHQSNKRKPPSTRGSFDFRVPKTDNDSKLDGSIDGRMRRENGKFGSHPTFDDHGEEANL